MNKNKGVANILKPFHCKRHHISIHSRLNYQTFTKKKPSPLRTESEW